MLLLVSAVIVVAAAAAQSTDETAALPCCGSPLRATVTLQNNTNLWLDAHIWPDGQYLPNDTVNFRLFDDDEQLFCVKLYPSHVQQDRQKEENDTIVVERSDNSTLYLLKIRFLSDGYSFVKHEFISYRIWKEIPRGKPLTVKIDGPVDTESLLLDRRPVCDLCNGTTPTTVKPTTTMEPTTKLKMSTTVKPLTTVEPTTTVKPTTTDPRPVSCDLPIKTLIDIGESSSLILQGSFNESGNSVGFTLETSDNFLMLIALDKEKQQLNINNEPFDVEFGETVLIRLHTVKKAFEVSLNGQKIVLIGHKGSTKGVYNLHVKGEFIVESFLVDKRSICDRCGGTNATNPNRRRLLGAN